MSVREVSGDLFTCGAQTIVCPTNVAGAMGAGLALAFKQKVPGLFAFYQQQHPPTQDADVLRLRSVRLHVFRCAPDRQVLLLPTKVHWALPSRVALLDHNLAQLAVSWRELGITSLGLPMLGCGLGGLDYVRQVRPMIHHHLDRLELDSVVLVP